MKVTAYVFVTLPTGPVLLRPGDTVPEGVSVTNPDVIDGDAPAAEPETPEAPEVPETPSEPETPETPADDVPETPAAVEPEPAPAPRKRASRTKAADSE